MDPATLNHFTCPFCDGYLSNFNPNIQPDVFKDRICTNCSQDGHSYCIISFSQSRPIYMIVAYQDYTATLFFASTLSPAYTTLSHYTTQGKQTLATLPELLDLNPSRPNEFLQTFRLLALFS